MIKGQLKTENRQKQRKIKPLKQPTKITRPPILLDKPIRQADVVHKVGDKDKNKQVGSNNTQSPDQNKNITRQSVCSSLLQTGNIQSFIDLFYISHKCLPNVMENKNYFGQKLVVPELPQQQESTLQFYADFSNSLIKAEVRPDSQRTQKQASMNEYNSIAFNYQDQGDYSTASYFYQKVIQLARSCKNKQYELIALLGLGKCHDQGKKQEKAIQILQDAFDNASTLQQKQLRGEMVRLIGKELIQIYIQKAYQLVKFDMEAALKSYESALAIAQRSAERQSQARISHKIGELYYLEGQYQKSVQYQEQYLLRLKQSIGDQDGRQNEEAADKKQVHGSLKIKEMEAHASLAKCYMKMKDIQQAEIHLNQYHRMAKELKAQNAVADSSYYLAKLWQQKGQKDKGINYYQSYFEAAKSEKADKKDRKLVDKARVTYAIAKANKNMQRYIGLFQGENSLKNLLEWKIKRILK